MRGGDHALWLSDGAIWFTVLEKPSSPQPPSPNLGEGRASLLSPKFGRGAGGEGQPRKGVNLKLTFPGANPHPRLEPFGRLETSVNYFLGNDPAKWRTNVPVWGGVRYVDLYPGVNLELTGEGGRVMPRLVCRTNWQFALRDVRLKVEGTDAVELAGGEGLRLTTAVGQFTLLLFQAVAADGTPLDLAPARPAVEGSEVTAPFCPSPLLRLFASPQDNPNDLLYATFLGGSHRDDGWGIAVDGAGNAYVTGTTYSPDFPTTPGAFDTSFNGWFDTFVTKLSLGVPALPVLSVSASSLDFGPVLVGGSKDLAFTLRNTGAGTLEGSCTTTAPFSLPDDCAFSLTTGQSKTVKVRFSPPSVGTFIGNVSFTSSGGNASPIVRGEGVELTICWTTPPPSSVTSGEAFTVAWSITGATTVEHVNVHWDPVDPTAITTCSSEISCSTVSPTISPFTLMAPLLTAPIVLKYAVHARLNGDGIDRFSEVVSVTVNPSPARLSPDPPTALAQFRSDGVKAIRIGGTTDGSTVFLQATVSDPDGDRVKLQVELRRLDEFGGAFRGEPTNESGPVPSGSQAQIIAFGLINGNYHWRARTIDATGATSEWISFGATRIAQRTLVWR